MSAFALSQASGVSPWSCPTLLNLDSLLAEWFSLISPKSTFIKQAWAPWCTIILICDRNPGQSYFILRVISNSYQLSCLIIVLISNFISSHEFWYPCSFIVTTCLLSLNFYPSIVQLWVQFFNFSMIFLVYCRCFVLDISKFIIKHVQIIAKWMQRYFNRINNPMVCLTCPSS